MEEEDREDRRARNPRRRTKRIRTATSPSTSRSEPGRCSCFLGCSTATCWDGAFFWKGGRSRGVGLGVLSRSISTNRFIFILQISRVWSHLRWRVVDDRCIGDEGGVTRWATAAITHIWSREGSYRMATLVLDHNCIVCMFGDGGRTFWRGPRWTCQTRVSGGEFFGNGGSPTPSLFHPMGSLFGTTISWDGTK